MNVLWLVGDQATTFGSTIFIKVSFRISIPDGSNRYCCVQIHCCGMIFLLQFFFFPHYVTPQHILHGSFKLLFFHSIFSHSPPPLSLVCAFLIFIFVAYILTQFSIPILYFQNCSFSLYFSPNSGFSLFYVSSIWHFFLKRHFHRHACISTQKQERKSQAGGVYTAGDDLLACTSTH